MTATTPIRLNLPVDQAIERIKREARGRKLYMHADITCRPAAPMDSDERTKSSHVLQVTVPSLARFLLNCHENTGGHAPFVVPICIDGEYVWVG